MLARATLDLLIERFDVREIRAVTRRAAGKEVQRIMTRRFSRGSRLPRWLTFWIIIATWCLAPGWRGVEAVTLSAAMLYSSDDFGNPAGLDWDNEQVATGLLYRTGPHPHWYRLGILSGLPSGSLGGPFLNGPDFSIEIPLALGVNDFTMVVEPGGGGGGDFQRFVLTLFFDGNLDFPGLSILLSRRDSPEKFAPQRNRGSVVLNFAVDAIRASVDPIYDDGMTRVSVSGVYFGWGDPPSKVDIVGPVAAAPSGTADVVGFVELLVEESSESSPVYGAGPAAPGLAPADIQGPISAAPIPGVAPRQGPAVSQIPVQRPLHQARTAEAPTPALPEGAVEGAPTPAMEEPTPDATPDRTTQQATPSQSRPTPSVTASPATPGTPARTPTSESGVVPGTPTPGRMPTGAVTIHPTRTAPGSVGQPLPTALEEQTPAGPAR